MRIRLSIGRSLLFACVLLAALVALLPMRIALDALDLADRGLSAREVGGSVWLGRLLEVRAGDAPLGDLVARISPVQLLIGRARIDIRRQGAGQAFSGAVGVTRHSFGLDDVNGPLPLSVASGQLPFEAIDLRDFSARFTDESCERADGYVRASFGPTAPILGGMSFSGTARCDGGALLLPLASQSGIDRISIRLFADGHYRVQTLLRPGDPAIAQALAAAGFAAHGTGYAMTVGGHL